jgi:hypothetical protein
LPNQRKTGFEGEVAGEFFDNKFGNVVLTFWVRTVSHLSRRFIKINRHLFNVKARIPGQFCLALGIHFTH